jgi:hypothetical protein
MQKNWDNWGRCTVSADNTTIPITLDHEGIDDAFLGKASLTWYWHENRWLRLQGSD